jgi:cell division topological specificity factor
MANFIDRVFRREAKSAHTARERLKLVLIHDRTDISPGIMDIMKDDIIQVISRHVEIYPDGVKIEMTQEGRSQRLIADIPLRIDHRRRIG